MNNQLLGQCLYYKGEKDCPPALRASDKQMMWFYESLWVKNSGHFDDNGEYEANGLSDFEKDDGVGLTLKKMLFNRFIQDAWNVKESIPLFKKWYVEKYKGRN